jgi:hypothetical protein
MGAAPASDYGLAVVANGVLSLKTLFLNTPTERPSAAWLNTRNIRHVRARKHRRTFFRYPAIRRLGRRSGCGDGNWPGSGEIDIFEFVNNGSQNGIPFFSVHWASATAGDDARTWADAAS